MFHQTLVYLKNNQGIEDAIELSPFFKNYLGAKKDDPNELRKVSITLSQLKARGYVEGSIILLGQKGNGYENNNLDDHRLLYKLEPEGYKYISEELRLKAQDDLLQRQTTSIENSNAQNVLVGQSVINTNSLTTTNFQSQKNFNLITIVVGALTFLTLAVYTYYTSKSITEESFLRLDSTLQNSTKRLDSMLQVQKGIDSSLRIVAGKDSLQKK